MNLWLDDVRLAPDGWVWAKDITAAKEYLLTGEVERASLDHDLGACDICMHGLSPEQWFWQHGAQEMPHCSHVGSGSDLVLWMAETGHWPKQKPTVHSLNPVGRQRMHGVIDRYFPDVADAVIAPA